MFDLEVVGRAVGTPSSPTDPSASRRSVDLSFLAKYPLVASGNVSIAGTSLDPFPIGVGIAAIRFVSLRSVQGASLQVRVTSGLGADQAFPVSGEWVMHAPAAGDEATSVSLVGTGQVEFLVAGE